MPAPAATALPVRQAAVLAYLVENQVANPLVYVEAGNLESNGVVRFPTLKALADKGLVDITWKRQGALYGSAKPYRIARLTPAGRQAHFDRLAAEAEAIGADEQAEEAENAALLAEHHPDAQAVRDDRAEHDALRGVRWVAGCPLPLEMCDPDVDHDHDPLPPALAAAVDHQSERDAAVAARVYTEQAQAIATLATALADGTLKGPRHAAVKRLTGMIAVLAAWTPDDRSGT